MQTRVQKWGNSIAVRIPKAFASEAKIGPDTLVELSVIDGKLIITPSPPTFKLSSLLAQITDENKHKEMDFGNAVGQEDW